MDYADKQTLISIAKVVGAIVAVGLLIWLGFAIFA
jgi:hypothetical protein